MPDEYDQLEEEAAAWLGQNPDDERADLVRKLNKSHRRVEDRITKAVEKAVAEAKAQWDQGHTRGQVFERLGIPKRLYRDFEGIDPTDEKAVQERIGELRADGITWAAPQSQQQANGQQQQQTPQDASQVALQQMQQAAAGGTTPGSSGDLATRMLDMNANPGKYTDDQRSAIIAEYNTEVVGASRQGTSGALG